MEDMVEFRPRVRLAQSAYNRLKKQAESNHRSITAELAVVVEGALDAWDKEEAWQERAERMVPEMGETLIDFSTGQVQHKPGKEEGI